MLKKEHIDRYREAILEGGSLALETATEAERLALRCICSKCLYCRVIPRHKSVLSETTTELLILVGTLQEGERSTVSFPKKMYPDITLYRGFITDIGEYVDMFNTDHCEYREKYIREHGLERAYRMIKIHASARKSQIHFSDRKYPPTAEQYETLRELMINAEGALDFRFVYDTNHPR